MTHTSSCLTFNQSANSWRQPCSATSTAHSPCPSELRCCCHAHTMTAALIGFSLLRRWRWRWRNKNNNNNKNKNTKSDNENENENCNFRQAAVARFHFTLLWPVFAGFSLTFFHRLPGFSFFSLAFLCNWRSLLPLSHSRSLPRLLFLRNKVYISHIHHFWQLQLIVCNVGQMDGPV